MSQDLRCDSKKLAVLVTPAADGVIEIKCDSRFCGAGRGVVVLHRFSTTDGELLSTTKYQSPERIKIG